MRFDIIEFTEAFGTAAQLRPSELPEVVFSGRSNVGKSSLINAIFNRKNLARVSSVPGKTITVNFFKGDGVNFVDLPGYGYAKRNFNEKKRWADLMETYFTDGRDIRLVIQLVDMRHPPTADDMGMIDFLVNSEQPFVVALTKCDKLNKGERESRRAGLREEFADYEGIHFVEFSSLTGEGVEEMKKIIEEAVED